MTWDLFLAAALIFALRVTDVSIGTIRVLYAVRGRRMLAASLGLLESAIFILAISRIMQDQNNPAKMLAYALGFAAGIFTGITIERWIASGTIFARIIARAQCPSLTTVLRDRGFGVTEIEGSGRAGDVSLYFVVAPRRREREILALIEEHAPDAFLTIDPVSRSLGGYQGTPAGSVRK